MADVTWTPQQRQAIETVGGTVVVSAAAGSGKTAVLVERVIRLLTDGERPLPPERLLVVTFTRAAAAEMKRKLKDALREKAAENPVAASALLNIDRAIISTMDSFCAKVVRENFESVGIAPDFRMMDDAELRALEKTTVESVLETYYAAQEADFIALTRQFASGSSDTVLTESIQNIYAYADSNPSPAQWLDGVAAEYATILPAAQTVWGKYLMANAARAVAHCLSLLRRALTAAEADEKTAEFYAPSVACDVEKYQNAHAVLRRGADWDAVAQTLKGLLPLTALPIKRGMGTNPCATRVKALRDSVKSIMEDLIASMSAPAAACEADARILKPVMTTLISCVKAYSDRLLENKHRANAYYFSDILHFALELFYETDGGEPRPTALCRKIAASFDAVLIDEYQDTTRAQDALFNAVSDGGKNLFVVGDVKQSIYAFRHATPEIFTERCASAADVNAGTFPARIILGKNFRSRAGILDFVNFVFSQLMTPDAGGILYNADEYLYFGGSDAGDMRDTDVILTETAPKADNLTVEAEKMAAYIYDVVASGQEITVKGETRRAKFSDFCILLRSAKGSADTIAETLKRHNIPAVFETKSDYFAFPETEALCALLRIVDNPRSDADLLSAMFFPLFGFTPDELATLRGLSADTLYACVLAAAEGCEDTALRKKCADFLNTLAVFRNYAVSMRTSDFVRYMIYETDLSALVLSMPAGTERLPRLEAFVDYAIAYENSGAVGYSGFIRYLNGIRQTGAEVPVAKVFGDIENAVTIMTVHKSKGLEFPFVLLADTARRFSNRDYTASVICDNDFGAAMHLQERLKLKRYETVPYAAVKAKKKFSAVSEEIRLLYVALTRAAYRLVIFGTTGNLEKTLRGAAAVVPPVGAPVPDAVLRCSNWLTLLLAALMRHPDCGALRDMADADCDIQPCESHVRVLLKNTEEPDGAADTPLAAETARLPFTPEMYDDLRRRIEYRYPYENLKGLPAKITASGFSDQAVDYGAARLNAPVFAENGGVGGAARGNAYHHFLHYCDFHALRGGVTAEQQRLMREGLLTREESALIDERKIAAFIDSAIGQKILSADKVYRELEFRLLLPAYAVYPEVDSKENILVQGVADLVFFDGADAVVVDYKTDMRADGATLADRYRRQVHIYKKAVEKLFDVTVSKTILYSISASEAIEV